MSWYGQLRQSDGTDTRTARRRSSKNISEVNNLGRTRRETKNYAEMAGDMTEMKELAWAEVRRESEEKLPESRKLQI